MKRPHICKPFKYDPRCERCVARWLAAWEALGEMLAYEGVRAA